MSRAIATRSRWRGLDALLASLNIPPSELKPRLLLSAVAEQIVAERGHHLASALIALGIGSSEPGKQWGAARFAELALALQRRSIGSVFVVGGPTERLLV
ncbi:MAG: hypothetical protein IPK63_09750 [Candidatus Competibacteraceae bacterium]|nr:hypothetical protein [Candidatus Competibacteraceae bacterium]